MINSSLGMVLLHYYSYMRSDSQTRHNPFFCVSVAAEHRTEYQVSAEMMSD
jgi:hypothetical protein